MKLAIKFSANFWLLVAVTMLFSCTHPVHAADKQVVFECDGERAIVTQHSTNPLILEVVRTKGIWMQVPDTKPRALVSFYNLDSGKVARIGKNYSDQYYLQFFKDVDYANAHQPERTLRCAIQKG